MAETYEEIVQKWYMKLRGDFTDLLMDKYKKTNMRLADAEISIRIFSSQYIRTLKKAESVQTGTGAIT